MPPALVGSGAMPYGSLSLTLLMKPAGMKTAPLSMPILPCANWLKTSLRSVVSGLGWVSPALVRLLR